MAKPQSSRAERRIAIAVSESLAIIEQNNLEDLDAAALVPVADSAEALHKALESLSSKVEQPGLSEEAADKMFADFKATGPQITDAEVDAIEKFATDNYPWGITRRGALVALTKSGEELIASIQERDSAVAFAAFAYSAGDYAERLRNLADLMERMEARTLLALCDREDMQDVIAEAKREQESES